MRDHQTIIEVQERANLGPDHPPVLTIRTEATDCFNQAAHAVAHLPDGEYVLALVLYSRNDDNTANREALWVMPFNITRNWMKEIGNRLARQINAPGGQA